MGRKGEEVERGTQWGDAVALAQDVEGLGEPEDFFDMRMHDDGKS